MKLEEIKAGLIKIAGGLATFYSPKMSAANQEQLRIMAVSLRQYADQLAQVAAIRAEILADLEKATNVAVGRVGAVENYIEKLRAQIAEGK